MHKTILIAFVSVSLTTGMTFAEPASKETTAAQVEKLGAIRARVGAKMTDLLKAINLSANGVSQAGTAVLTQYQQTVAALQKRAAQESAKPADARDQALIDSTNAKLEKISALWNAHATKDSPAFNQAISDIQGAANQLSSIVSSLTTIDQNWVRADLDPTLLTSTLAAVDKRIDELSVAATPLLENFKKLCVERERAMQE